MRTILRPQEVLLLRLGQPVGMCNGGDSDSQANTSTANNTQNTAYNTDKRSVASEEAVSVTGEGNFIDRSTATANSTSFSDSSNRSTNFADSSKRDSENVTTTNITTTDFGSVGKSLEGMGAIASRVVGLADTSVMGALESVNKTGANNLAFALKAFDVSSAQSANALTTSREVMGFADKAINQSKAAFAEAKDGGTNKTMLIVGLAVVGAVGVALAMR